MSIELVPYDGREDWLAKRVGIGGSDAAAVCGQSKWKSPLELYLQKTGEIPEEEENEAMRRGTLLEPVVRQMYADQTGNAVEEVPAIIRNSKFPWAFANVDGKVVGTTRAFEAKTAYHRLGWGEPGSDDIPVAYQFQCQHYCAVAECDGVDVAVMFAGFDVQIYSVDRDKEFIGLLMEQEAEFWDMVQARNPPDPTTAEDIARRFPISTPASVQGTPELLDSVGSIVSIKEKIKALESLLEQYQNDVKLAIGKNEALEYQGEIIATWKSTKPRTTFDRKAFALKHPTVYQRYCNQGKQGRMFLVKDKPLVQIAAETAAITGLLKQQ